MWPNLQFPADLATFTKDILNGKLYFLFSGITISSPKCGQNLLNQTQFVCKNNKGYGPFEYHVKNIPNK